MHKGADKTLTARIRPKRSRWSPDVFDRAQDLYNARPTPAPGRLAEQLSREQAELGETPSESTIRDWIKNGWITLDPEDAPWSMTQSQGEDAALILDVIRALISESGQPFSWPRRPSRQVASWIVRIRRAYPDITDMRAVYFAATLARRGGDSLERVETLLAFTPWRDDAEALARAIYKGLVSQKVADNFGFERAVIRHQVRFEREEHGNG